MVGLGHSHEEGEHRAAATDDDPELQELLLPTAILACVPVEGPGEAVLVEADTSAGGLVQEKPVLQVRVRLGREGRLGVEEAAHPADDRGTLDVC